MLAGNALHTDLVPDAALGGFFGYLLCALGQDVGFPCPQGGAGALARALVRRAEERGVRIVCDARVERVLVHRATARGVRLADGTELAARRAVLADVDAPLLYLSLLPREAVPRAVLADIRRFDRDWATVKVDWTLDAPIPWTHRDARRAPVVHVGDPFGPYAYEIEAGRVPERPMLVMGQYAIAAGKETAWAYAHVPHGAGLDVDEFAARMENEVEALAPGFRALVRARRAWSPSDLEARDENLAGGALGGGSSKLHQQLVFRPTPGLGRPETPVARLYLASSSAHPGGGVHGAPGAIAARAALTAWRVRRATYAVAAALTMRGAGLRPRGGG